MDRDVSASVNEDRMSEMLIHSATQSLYGGSSHSSGSSRRWLGCAWNGSQRPGWWMNMWMNPRPKAATSRLTTQTACGKHWITCFWYDWQLIHRQKLNNEGILKNHSLHARRQPHLTIAGSGPNHCESAWGGITFANPTISLLNTIQRCIIPKIQYLGILTNMSSCNFWLHGKLMPWSRAQQLNTKPTHSPLLLHASFITLFTLAFYLSTKIAHCDWNHPSRNKKTNLIQRSSSTADLIHLLLKIIHILKPDKPLTRCWSKASLTAQSSPESLKCESWLMSQILQEIQRV